jgi:hypothetical protein
MEVWSAATSRVIARGDREEMLRFADDLERNARRDDSKLMPAARRTPESRAGWLRDAQLLRRLASK